MGKSLEEELTDVVNNHPRDSEVYLFATTLLWGLENIETLEFKQLLEPL